MKGILFTEILYNKTVRKEKTMTRRAGKSLAVINEAPDDWNVYDNVTGETGRYDWYVLLARNNKAGKVIHVKPNYKVGEVLYIKEPWRPIYYDESGGGDIEYKYDFEENRRGGFPWENKMFMPKRHARAFVRITNIKCERLFDISFKDCLKEGCEYRIVDIPDSGGQVKTTYPSYGEFKICKTIQESYFSLFRFANNYPKKKEIENIWCFCYDYVLCDVNGREI